MFRKTDHEYPVYAHPTLVLKCDFSEKQGTVGWSIMWVDKSRSVVKFQSWILLRELVSDRVNNFLLDRAEPLFLRTHGWVNFSRVTVCCMLHRSLSAVLLWNKFHSWHIVLDTCAPYTLLNFIYLFISLLNLYPDSELIIINIIKKNLHSVHRSLEIHNCALTSSTTSPPPPQPCPAVRGWLVARVWCWEFAGYATGSTWRASSSLNAFSTMTVDDKLTLWSHWHS